MDNAMKSQMLGSIGSLGGLYYAFKKNKGFWGYVGFGLLGSVVGYTLGRVIFPTDATMVTTTTTTETDSEKKS